MMDIKTCNTDKLQACDRTGKKCNEENCPCPDRQCVRHGKCCECINYHRSRSSKVKCMR
jgi:hypothetical protein